MSASTPHSEVPTMLANVAASSPDLMALLTMEGELTWVSARWERTVGWTSAELQTTPMTQWVHDTDRKSVAAYLSDVADGDVMPPMRTRLRTKDGSWRWYEWTLAPCEDAQLFAVGRDVTESMGQEVLGGRREQLLRMAERLAVSGQWFAEFASGYVYWSDRVFEIHGRVPGDYIPDLETAIDAYHPDDRDAVRRHIDRSVEDRVPFDFELRIVRPCGEVRVVHSIGHPEVDPVTDEVIGLFGVFQDITEDRRSRRLEEMELFSYGAAHDLRQPIRHISGMMYMLGRGLELSPQQQVLWDHMDSALSHMDGLVQDLLAFGNASIGRPDAPVSLTDTVAEVRASLADDLVQSGAELVGGDLPIVLGDEPRLRRVFQNLLSNAIKYRDRDRPLRIEVVSRSEGPWCVVDIRDNGVGFTNESAKRLFDPFRRESTSSDGVGLGLAIVRRIVTQMGGSVSATGQPGVGATFSLKLRASHDAVAVPVQENNSGS